LLAASTFVSRFGAELKTHVERNLDAADIKCPRYDFAEIAVVLCKNYLALGETACPTAGSYVFSMVEQAVSPVRSLASAISQTFSPPRLG